MAVQETRQGDASSDSDATYAAACAAYLAATGGPPERRWRALLRLTTADPVLWAWVQPRLSYATGVARLDGRDARGAALGPAQRLLLGVARNLYQGQGAVDLAAVAEGLDGARFGAVLLALDAYRA